jgi:hypothetical protein
VAGGELEEQHEGVAIGRPRVRTGIALHRQPDAGKSET